MARTTDAGSRGDRGFTFLELLIAVAILGTAFTVLLSAHATAIRQEGRARSLMRATLLARQVLTETEIADDLPLGTQEGEFGEGFEGFTWNRRVETTEFPRIRQVTIQVTWPSGSGPASTDLVYYVVVEGEP